VSANFDAHSRWVGETAMNQRRVSNNRFLVLYNQALTIALRRPEYTTDLKVQLSTLES
jgi:hypothetical protein